MDSSCVVAFMANIEKWEEGKEDENQVFARFWGLHVGLHQRSDFATSRRTWTISCPTCIRSPSGGQQDVGFFLHGSHRVDSNRVPCMEHKESFLMKSLHYDIEVLCIIQRRLLWYSSPRHLYEILIQGGVFELAMSKNQESYGDIFHHLLLGQATRQGPH